ncbi:SDR family NAD(P)-dependent oxidoreductase [Rhodopila sp.]|uniref:SDR family NAD(P)-dependent oxidoreductase n=1 Tax=Rhodopila sp. TaxID=2480087 RepID=UPI003D0A7B7B
MPAMACFDSAKILVTGADGFIGSHLTERLARAGAAVTALSLYNSFDGHGWLDDLPANLSGNLSLVRGDIRDPSFVRNLVSGQDIILHLAALIAIPHSYVAARSYVETNVLGTLNVLEASRECAPGRVVVTSTSEVYGTAQTIPIAESHPLHGQSPYSATKIGADMLAEAYARSFGLPVVILRPFNTFGPRQSERAVIPTIIRQALDPTCRMLKLGDTTTLRDFTFVEDTVSAFLAVAAAPSIDYGRPYNAGTGIAVSVADVIAMVSDLTETNKPAEQDCQRLRPAESEVRALIADSRRLTADTGWHAETSLNKGLAETIAWWRTRFERGKVHQSRTYMT